MIDQPEQVERFWPSGDEGLAWLSGRLPAHVDEVAWRRRRRLARGVGFEISVDLVLQLPMKGAGHELFEALQTMGVVGETEFTARTNTEAALGSETAMLRPTQR